MKILLLTDIPPTQDYTAGIVLNQLCSFLPKKNLAIFVVLNKRLKPKTPKWLEQIPIKYVEKPNENWRIFLPSFLSAAYSLASSFIMEKYISLTAINKIINQAVQFGIEQKVDIVWCILEGQTMVRLAVPVSERLSVPLLTEVWDPLDWWLRDNRVNLLTRRGIYQEFDKAISHSHACATASEEMAKKYKKKYGIKTIPFLPSVDKKIAFPPQTRINSQNELIIGFAGQLYAKDEWLALIDALTQSNWKIGQRLVRIRVLGYHINLNNSPGINVEFLGWRSQIETIKLMSECDLLYCPYWFSAVYKNVANLSFPAKLTTYFAAGKPVFFHGPSYSAPAKFLKRNQAAVICHSLNPKKILNLLKKITSDKSLYKNLSLTSNKMFIDFFTLDNLKKNFQEFIQSAKLEEIKK